MPTRPVSPFLSDLRTGALLALAAAGCVPDYATEDSADTCGQDLDLLEPGEPYSGGTTRVLACAEAPADLQCEDPADVDGGSLVTHSDPACGYDADVTCGPVVGVVDGACCYAVRIEGEWCAGRPLTVGSEARTAAEGPPGDWCGADGIRADALSGGARARLAALWREDAAQEHASVAAFARAALQLMALGAPAEVLAGLARAQADEVAHARTCFGIAAALDGRARGPGPLAVDGLLAGTDPEAVLVDTLVGGAVGETLAAARAHAAALAARDPAVAAALHAIAADEARHAALAWRIAGWMLAERPALRGAAARALAAPPHLPPRPLGGAPEGWGHLPAAEIDAVHAAAWRAVVEPARERLLGRRAAAPARA